MRRVTFSSGAMAAAGAPTFADIVNGPTGIVHFVDSVIIPFIYILAFLFFLIGIVRFFFTGGEENRTKGKTFVIWSLIAMVILFGFWGIVHLLLTVIPGA